MFCHLQPPQIPKCSQTGSILFIDLTLNFSIFPKYVPFLFLLMITSTISPGTAFSKKTVLPDCDFATDFPLSAMSTTSQFSSIFLELTLDI